MAKPEEIRSSVQKRLVRVIELLTEQTQTASIIHDETSHTRNTDELQQLLDASHPADIAYMLEALPLGQRLMAWELVKADRDGEILLEVSDAVRETLIEYMDEQELVAATGQLEADEIADLAPDLPSEVIKDVFKLLREQLREAMSYAESTVGALMNFDMVQIREDVTLEVVLRYLRRLDELPDHTDQLFVVDRQEHLKGLLPVNILLVTDLDVVVSDVMQRDIVKFSTDNDADDGGFSGFCVF
jgi:magnesium transporter